MNQLESSVFPSLHQRKGWLRHQGNIAKPPAKRKRDSAQPQVKQPQPGWFSFWFSIGKPPRPRDQRKLRDILLLARPPLLAVMQGGEYARFQFVHTFYERPRCIFCAKPCARHNNRLLVSGQVSTVLVTRNQSLARPCAKYQREFRIWSALSLMRNSQFLIWSELPPMRKSSFLIGVSLSLIRNDQFLIWGELTPMRDSPFLIGVWLPLMRKSRYLIGV